VSDPNIEVVLTDERAFHCFKLVFHATTEGQPLEIYLRTRRRQLISSRSWR